MKLYKKGAHLTKKKAEQGEIYTVFCICHKFSFLLSWSIITVLQSCALWFFGVKKVCGRGRGDLSQRA